LASVQGNRGHIAFEPPVPHLVHAAREMGFGTVVKAVLVFKNRFWNDKNFEIHCQQIPDLGFLVNGTAFPVFWPGLEGPVFTITGWAGGPRAEKLMHYSDEELKATAVFSLAHALMCKQELVKEQLLEVQVFNWSREPYARGAYSYATPATAQAIKLFAEPLANTVYFAGEAFGKTMGTVEAALESAEETVKRIL
jgi:monoamine oxidase